MIIEQRKFTAFDTIRLPFRCAPALTILIAVQMVLAGVVPTLQVLASTAFINAALAVVGGSTARSNIYFPMAAVVGLIAYTWISGELSRFAQTRLELSARKEFRTAITQKRTRLAYRYIEDNKSWDLISRVARTPETQIKTSYIEFLNMLSGLLQVMGILLLLISYVWWAALIITAFSVPMVWLALKSGRANYEASREASKYKRKYEYLSEVLSSRETVEERTLFGYSGRLNQLFRKQFEASRKIEIKTEWKWFVKMKAGGIIFGLISIMITMVLLQPVLAGTISVGLFISLVTAVFSLVQLMSWSLTNSVDQLARHREYLKDLTEFAALEETPGAELPPTTPPPVFESLVFRNVRFKYPGTDNYILDGLTLEIHAGRHYAFVGVNGAGKTTITKIITGLYDDYEGEILLNGKPLASYTQNGLKSFFSVVYQDFAKYSIPFADNIALGDVNSMTKDGVYGAVLAATGNVGLQEVVYSQPKGLLTPLGKIEEDGQDLSGGQWQRVAMARSVINPAPVRILDEPTASMDPISESKLYEEFENISRGGTTLFISHRLGSTKLADYIYIIGSGRVLEQGSHQELMEAGGVYAGMFQSQRSWYQ